MREICKIIGIGFEDSLLHPTFNRLPGGQNTSFKNGKRRDVLGEQDIGRVGKHIDYIEIIQEYLLEIP